MLISYFCNIARIFLLTLNIIKNKYYDLTYGHEQSSAQLGFHYSWYRLAVAYLLWNHVQLLLAHVKGLEQFGIIFLEIWTDFLILCISKKIHPISFFWNVKNLSLFSFTRVLIKWENSNLASSATEGLIFLYSTNFVSNFSNMSSLASEHSTMYDGNKHFKHL